MTPPVNRQEIEAAAVRIAPYTRRTPVLALEPEAFGMPLVLKLELLQVTGSFKPRGAFNRVLSATPNAAGLIAASGGNHGLAVAHVARRLGLRAEIFVPEVVSDVKLAKLRAAGSGIEVRVEGALYQDAHEASMRRAAETGALVVHPYDQHEVIAGQGTMAAELEDQVPDLDTVLVAVGGGGLVAGVACWFGDRVRIVAVEPERSCALTAALAAGRPVDVEVSGVAADSLGARSVGGLAFEAARAHVDTAVTVTDEAILDARSRLWSECRLVAEPGGAAALAAVASGAYVPSPEERVVVVVCGANTEPGAVAVQNEAKRPEVIER